MYRALPMFACAFCISFTASTHAAHRGHVTTAASSVSMQNVADSFGNRTQSGKGAVRLSSQDLDYGTGYDPKGLDLLVPGSPVPAKWTVTCTGGTCSHWTLPAAHTAEGSSAITPVPSAAGVTAQLNGGPYTFLVQAEDASNNILASSTLTRTIVDDDGSGTHCGAINFGDSDPTSGIVPSGWAGSSDGCTIYFSTGMVRVANRLSFGLGFSHPTTIAWSDPGRIGALAVLETSGAQANKVTIRGLINTFEAVPTGSTFCFNLNGTSGSVINVDGAECRLSSSVRAAGAGSLGILNLPEGATAGGTIQNFGGDWVGGGFTVRSNYTYKNWYVRHSQGDNINFESASNCTITDGIIISPMLPSPVHPDAWQIKDGGTPHGCVVKRVGFVQAGGDLDTQGIFFGGGPTGVISTTGYISDSSCSGAAGQTLCFVTGGMQSNADGSSIYSTSGSPLSISDGVKVNCGTSNCGGLTKVALVGLAVDTTFGSAGSPVPIYGYSNVNMTWDQFFNTGFLVNGISISASGGITDITHYANVYQPTSGVTPQGTPDTHFNNCSTAPVFTGSLTVGPGMEYNKWRNAGCANTTKTNVLEANNNTTTLATYYQNGDPTAYLNALSSAQWDALTVPQVLARVCKALTPKVGGPLDLGGGDWANPFNASGEWVDGTAVPGC